MLRGLLALVFACSLAQAETRNNYTYVEAGYASTGVSFFVVGEEYGDGTKLSASWQFAEQWFVYASSLNSDGHEHYTNDYIEANEQSLNVGYVFASTRKTDWFTRVGRVHRELPGANIYQPYPQEDYTLMQDYYSNSIAFGARHRLTKRIELSWLAEALTGSDDDARASVNIRFFPTDALSVGYQVALSGELAEFILNVRYQF